MSGQEGPAKYKRSRWYHRRDARFLIFVGVALATYNGQGYLFGPGRISDQLGVAIRKSDERVDIVVTSRFPAEAFHFGAYQRIGVIRGGKDKDMSLFAVKPDDVRMLSRKYWIERIDLAPRE